MNLLLKFSNVQLSVVNGYLQLNFNADYWYDFQIPQAINIQIVTENNTYIQKFQMQDHLRQNTVITCNDLAILDPHCNNSFNYLNRQKVKVLINNQSFSKRIYHGELQNDAKNSMVAVISSMTVVLVFIIILSASVYHCVKNRIGCCWCCKCCNSKKNVKQQPMNKQVVRADRKVVQLPAYVAAPPLLAAYSIQPPNSQIVAQPTAVLTQNSPPVFPNIL